MSTRAGPVLDRTRSLSYGTRQTDVSARQGDGLIDRHTCTRQVRLVVVVRARQANVPSRMRVGVRRRATGPIVCGRTSSQPNADLPCPAGCVIGSLLPPRDLAGPTTDAAPVKPERRPRRPRSTRQHNNQILRYLQKYSKVVESLGRIEQPERSDGVGNGSIGSR